MNSNLDAYISEGTPERIRERYRRLYEQAKAADFGELDENIVVIDTETTGFSFNHDELTQIAAARMEHGKIVDWYVTFVNPGKPIPDDVAHLTNIHDEDVADAPSPDEALARLVEFTGDAKVVAHNVDFDRTFTTRHPSGYPLLDNIWIDSLDLARIALPRMRSHRLIDLVKAFGAPTSTHRADDDVAATCALFRILLAAVAAMPPELVKCIALMAPVEQWNTAVVFEHFADPGVKSFSLKALRHESMTSFDRRPRVDAKTLQTMEYPSREEIIEAFSQAGLVGKLYGDFEPREEQLTMAEEVRAAFEASENLVVEAGTGVGKSMAYLVPAVLMAKRNGIAVGVATKTNALLDQLVYHELPALSDALGGVTYASLKGFSHYPCLRKVNRFVKEGVRMVDVQGVEHSQAPALGALLSFIDQTDFDDMDGLKMDYRVVPRRAVTTTSHDCLRRKCPFFGTTCFVHGARRFAEAADVVVTNHTLLFCDAAADNGLLPPVRYWVLDEAHGAEAEARRAFSLEIAAEDVIRLAQRVASGESRNVFVRAERKLAGTLNDEGETLFMGLAGKAKSAGDSFATAAHEFVPHMKDLLFFDPNKRSKSYDRTELWLNDDIRASATFDALRTTAKAAQSAAEKLITSSQELVGYLENIEGAAEPQREIASVAMDLRDLVGAIEVIFGPKSDSYAYAAELCKKKDKQTDKLEALIVNVGAALEDKLYSQTRSIVFASATLSIDGKFTSFENAMGLNAGEGTLARTCQLDSSYDFDANMTIYVASDMPEPSDPHYLDELERLITGAHIAQQGSMLTLFTNRREMEKCFDVVQPVLKEEDLRLVCQKWGVSVKGLRDDFIADKHLSLFALKSFWEGFDAPGSTLRGVIIPKLPFSKPTDPLSCERATRDDHAWSHYALPQAVLETKQAAGRLIRKATDKGVLILADKRLVTKSYGKVFLHSLPSKTIEVCTIDEIISRIAATNE